MNDKEIVKKIIEEASIGMFTTLDKEQLYSRPIAVSQVEDNGTLWFFTDINSEKVDEIINNRNVNFSFSNYDDGEYVSVSGRAYVIQDQAKIDELWSLFIKAWFPEGKQSDRLTLIKVVPNTVQFWNDSSSKIAKLYKMGKAIVTGKSYTQVGDGENKTVKY